MRYKHASLAATLLLTAVALVGRPERAYTQQQAAALEFIPATPLSIERGKETQLQLQNNTAEPLRVTFRVVEIQPEGSTRMAEHVKFNPVELHLNPAGGGRVTVSFGDKFQPEAGHDSGYIVASGPESKSFARRRFQITTPREAGKTPPTYLVEKWEATVNYYPWEDWFSATQDEGVPLEKPIPFGLGRDDTNSDVGENPLARLVSEYGDTALIKPGGEIRPLPGKLFGVPLEFQSKGHPGKYEGSIAVPGGAADKPAENVKSPAGQDAGGKVKLTIIVADHIAFPAIALLAGIVLAFYFKQRYISVSRPLLVLEERAVRLQADFLKADERFKRESAGRAYSNYSLRGDIWNQLEGLVTRISALRRMNFLTLNPADTQPVEASLDDLSTQVVLWGALAGRLAALEAARSRGTPTQKPPFDLTHDDPAIFTAAARLLEGAEITVEQFKWLSAQIEEKIRLLSAWDELNERAAAAWADIHDPADPSKLRPVPPEDAARLIITYETLVGVWMRLWTSEAYNLDSTRNELDTVRNNVAVLSRHWDAVEALGPEAEMAGRMAAEANVEADGLGAEERDPAVRAQHLNEGLLARLQRHRWVRAALDFILILLTVSASLYSGLAELYFGKPFGTGLDYVKALAWGFAAQVVLSTLVTGLNILWSSKSALPLART